jgi:hypothetical protein
MEDCLPEYINDQKVFGRIEITQEIHSKTQHSFGGIEEKCNIDYHV